MTVAECLRHGWTEVTALDLVTLQRGRYTKTRTHRCERRMAKHLISTLTADDHENDMADGLP